MTACSHRIVDSLLYVRRHNDRSDLSFRNGATGIRPREIAILRGLGSPLPAPPKKGTASATTRKRYPLTRPARARRRAGPAQKGAGEKKRENGDPNPREVHSRKIQHPRSRPRSRRGSASKRNRLVSLRRLSGKPLPSSCPGLARASTSYGREQDVDGRNESGHDE